MTVLRLNNVHSASDWCWLALYLALLSIAPVWLADLPAPVSIGLSLVAGLLLVRFRRQAAADWHMLELAPDHQLLCRNSQGASRGEWLWIRLFAGRWLVVAGLLSGFRQRFYINLSRQDDHNARTARIFVRHYYK
ncbi:MAG: hypothetical protein Tsb002_31210 [Wenzhouxiangellaceae bacterium]